MNLKSMLVLALMLPCGAMRAALPPIPYPVFSEEEKIRIVQEHKERGEAESQRRYQRLNTHDQMVRVLIKGDMQPLDQLLEKQDVEGLWDVFNAIYLRQFGWNVLKTHYGEAEYLGKGHEFMARIREETRARLVQIPGHARFFGDQIDDISNKVGYFHKRTGLMHRLAELGSMEAIQQIARFLEDSRKPEGNFHDPDSGQTNPDVNWVAAVHMMHKALGAASPITVNSSGHPSVQGYETMIAWWKTDAAKPYRDWKHETHEPMPPPRLRAKPLMAVQPGSAADGQNGAPLASGSTSGLPVWLLITLCAGGIAAATLLAARKRRR